ncbi:branched-chain amino acid transport system substrate-binding protein [Psychromicrobium silvestre]|uniref:Branched-chain amino acid transport system substrate-binding protein n=1 Tax=Psychromicrobium silvestre TaxID=1645614 RepID=A0A7Y9S5Y5_9MICC|nr:ABC transporter substrate-binding protein [Psychromicrobium silvestre]NYE94730.1 branched-chain amino acid transport system substrate-binding protein [Psychromicrobium silvestre]
MKNRTIQLAALAAAGVLLLAACGEDTNSNNSANNTSSGGDIVVGSVNALSGGATFPEASQAAQAVFDQVNAAGGIKGRKINYTITDDKGDPATAAQSARDVVESKNAVALVGSASLLDCDVNAKYYQQNGILSIQGTGVDQACFSSPAVSPVNVGPFLDTEMTLTYGSETLGLDKICGFLEIAGATGPAYKAAIDNWKKKTGKDLLFLDDSVPYGSPDYTPQVIKAKNAGCKAVYINATEPDGLGMLKAAEAQGFTDVTWLFLTSTYSEQFAQAAGKVGNGVYVPAEFAPYTDPNESANKDWRELMTSKNIPLTSFAQGGYLAAKYFVEVLQGISGDITRASVTQALKDMKPISNPMVGTPYVFGTADKHNSSTGVWPVKLENGAWVKAANNWLLQK